MPTAKLTYFNGTGLGEGIRYLLSYGGVEFEDNRVTSEAFAAMKDKLPLGQLPILEYQGQTMYQSVAISRYLANSFNLAGKDAVEKGTCDVAVDTINDIRAALAKYAYEKHAEAKKQKKEEALKNAKFLVGKIENYLNKNGGHFLKDGQMSWADIFLASITDYLNRMAEEDIFADAPKIKALKAKVEAVPSISKYLEKRPVGDF
ncbi:glutathione S-transferase-like [Cloeon dipterum]|uniref:glutathione S-transferase-like n=1 Tax=Cloeon dipterum TaxID=197152 RepID=UPI0032203817